MTKVMGILPLVYVLVAAYISYDIKYAWALQYMWSVYEVCKHVWR